MWHHAGHCNLLYRNLSWGFFSIRTLALSHLRVQKPHFGTFQPLHPSVFHIRSTHIPSCYLPTAVPCCLPLFTNAFRFWIVQGRRYLRLQGPCCCERTAPLTSQNFQTEFGPHFDVCSLNLPCSLSLPLHCCHEHCFRFFFVAVFQIPHRKVTLTKSSGSSTIVFPDVPC